MRLEDLKARVASEQYVVDPTRVAEALLAPPTRADRRAARRRRSPTGARSPRDGPRAACR